MTLTIKELVAYVPAEDFELSKRFYTALGFELTEAWGGDVDCKLGGARFRLQNYYNKNWAENFMMLLPIDDAESWHAHAKKVIDEGSFAHARYDKQIEIIGDTQLFHVWDPCGVLLIFLT